MKNILLIITFFCIWQNNFAQDRILNAGEYLYESNPGFSYPIKTYLISANGKYSFENVTTTTSTGESWKSWLLINQWTGEVVYSSKGHDAYIDSVLSLGRVAQFYAGSCFSQQQYSCQTKIQNGIWAYVPLLASYAQYQDSGQYAVDASGSYTIIGGPFEFIGIPSAFQDFNLDVPIPTDNEVYQNNGGVFSVPYDKQAAALVLLDDGNLIIVNASNQILWETGTSEYDMVEYKYNKRFRDLVLNFENGIALASPGDVQVVITIIGQTNAPCVLIASTFAQMLPGDNFSSLNVTGSGYIELNSLGLATRNNSRRASTKTLKTEVVLSPTNFTVYPNPTAGEVNFVTGKSDEEIQSITITDIIGRIISKNSSIDKVDLSSNSSGIYLYKVETNKQTYSGKLIKK